ncbi:MAG: hypothetical protein ACI8PT_004102 [Gammaproteobacteria bacterium]|jgi:hypothetical protein
MLNGTYKPEFTMNAVLQLALASVCGVICLGARAESTAPKAPLATVHESGVHMSGISGDPDTPRRHYRLRLPQRLAPAEAQRIYGIVGGALARGYSSGRDNAAKGYQQWRRYNQTPYLSTVHGNHYLNHYANDIAAAYGAFEEAGTLPVGSVLAKDSYAVTETGGLVLGPLFLMEKMAAGFNPISGNWRYTLIQPDGQLLGETNGRGTVSVNYCIGCHLTKASNDHLFFVPEAFRVR